MIIVFDASLKDLSKRYYYSDSMAKSPSNIRWSDLRLCDKIDKIKARARTNVNEEVEGF